jgi:hypothetical protein
MKQTTNSILMIRPVRLEWTNKRQLIIIIKKY